MQNCSELRSVTPNWSALMMASFGLKTYPRCAPSSPFQISGAWRLE
jgi:hypothetical protein